MRLAFLAYSRFGVWGFGALGLWGFVSGLGFEVLGKKEPLRSSSELSPSRSRR